MDVPGGLRKREDNSVIAFSGPKLGVSGGEPPGVGVQFDWYLVHLRRIGMSMERVMERPGARTLTRFLIGECRLPARPAFIAIDLTFGEQPLR